MKVKDQKKQTEIAFNYRHAAADTSFICQKNILKVIPQFEFTQIDSLINVAMKRSNAEYSIANVYWEVGSYYEANKKFTSYRNKFEIYLLLINGNKYYVQKIDNFGYFKMKKIDWRQAVFFLKEHFAKMKGEELLPKTDTTYDKHGNQIFVTNSFDHEPIRDVRIYKGSDSLCYIYPASYSHNTSNLQTSKFAFLKVIDKVKDKYNRKRAKRTSLIWGKSAE